MILLVLLINFIFFNEGLNYGSILDNMILEIGGNSDFCLHLTHQFCSESAHADGLDKDVKFALQ